jgi:hypothetical protein
MHWTKEALAARVDQLGPGRELERFAENLDDGGRAILQELLLERSGGLQYAVRERFEARGWLRRTWQRSGPGSQHRGEHR